MENQNVSVLYTKEEEGQASLRKMMDENGTHLLRLCYLYLKDRQMAEDALQDTFYKAYVSYGGFRGESSEKTWLTKIAVNVCKNYLRKRKFLFFSQQEKEEIPYYEKYDMVQEKQDLMEAIFSLPDKYRMVVLLYYYEELKITEISRILQIPEGTVSVRLKRGKEKLKSQLKEWYYGE